MRPGHQRRVRPADQGPPGLRHHAVLNSADTITLRLAGFDFAIHRGPGAPPPRLPMVCDQFIVPVTDRPPVLHCTTLPADSERLPPVDPSRIVWQSDHWCLAAETTAPLSPWLLALHALPDERRVTVARFARDFATAELIPRWGRHAAPADFAWNYPCDQVVVLNRLAPLGVTVVHAGAVAFGEDGAMFMGRSGAGKTTLSRLCRDAGATLLNDDRQFLRIEDGSVLVEPTPWHGSDPEVNRRAVPLQAIFLLEQAPHNRVTPIHGAEAAARLVGNTVAPFYFAASMEHVLATCDEITARVPVFRLEFTPTQDAVELVRAHI